MPVKKPTKKKVAPVKFGGYLVTRKYGDPKHVTTFTAALEAIRADLEVLAADASRRGTSEDRARISGAHKGVSSWAAAQLPLGLDVLVDEYTGVRYIVTVSAA